MSPSSRSEVREFLLRPDEFFESHDPAGTLVVAFAVVVVLAVATAVATVLVGSMLAGAIDATVTMDNPERPPDWMCEETQPSTPTVGCDQPETVERDVGTLVSEAVTDYVPFVLFAPFVMWLVAGVVVFLAGLVAGGSPSLRGSVALSGWAAVPELFRLVVGLVAVGYALSTTTITSVARAEAAVEAALAPVEPVLALATVVTVAWQWHLLSGGLVAEADVGRRAAALALAAPLGAWLLFALV